MRKVLLAMRRAITTEQRIAAAQAAKQLLVIHSLFHSSQHIACYVAQQDEFDCAPLIQEICRLGKKCYLPVLCPKQSHFLEFAAYRPEDPLRLNRYKILEPEANDKIATEKLDLVIVPLLAFDERGYRLGMGGGYYDRTFTFKRERKVAEKPYLLGLGYEAQKVAKVPNDAWDVMLDGVLTEEELRQSF